MLKIQNWY